MNRKQNRFRARLARGLLQKRHTAREIALNGGTDTTYTIASAIRDYLLRRPHAADTARGVREWWLVDHARRFSREEVDAALDYLAARAMVAAENNPDGRRIWRAGPRLADDLTPDRG